MNGRRCAYEALKLTQNGAYSNLALNDALKSASDEREKRFAAKLLYTTLDNLLYIDFIIDSYAAGSLKTPVRNVLRTGVCQLLYMNAPESAVCNESVKLAKALGKGAVAGVVNGILRAVAKNKNALPEAPNISIKYSMPQYIVDMLTRDYGAEETRKLLEYSPKNELCVRQNAFVPTDEPPEGRRGRLVSDAIYVSGFGAVAVNPLFTSGEATAQSESSMLVCRVLDPKPDESVLDACAAPGGKTAYIAQLMGQQGELAAWDVHAHRVKLIENTLARLKITNVKTEIKDAAVYDQGYEKRFDRVLVDAPCSGLGVTGSKPDIKYSRDAEAIAQLAKLQLLLLKTCADYVKPGGVLVYSTCTVTSEENGGVVDAFLKERADFAPDDIMSYFPPDFDRERLKNGRVQLLPHIDGTEGFFICRLRRA